MEIVQRKMLLTFGLDEQSSESIFLETSTGVKTDVQKGYVMMRAWSITGISTDLEVLENNGYSEVEIIIYKNGFHPVHLGNQHLYACSAGSAMHSFNF